MHSNDYISISLKNKKLKGKLQNLRKYKITVLSNVTVNISKEIFEYYLRKEKINANVIIGDTNNIVKEAENFSNHDCVVIFYEIGNCIKDLCYQIGSYDISQLQEALNKAEYEFSTIMSLLSKTSLVIINTVSSLTFGITGRGKNNLEILSQKLNKFLYENAPSNFQIIDINSIFSALSWHKSISLRDYSLYLAPYTFDFFIYYINLIKPIILYNNGLMKKAIIFDCDNTLWKGIAGEDENLIVYAEVQQLTKGLLGNGIFLCLCSKNNVEDIAAVFNDNEQMVLSFDDFISKKINWSDKTTNIIEIAQELNISIEDIVYIDDDDFELRYIKKRLPQLITYKVPNNYYSYLQVFNEICDLFYRPFKTNEDVLRNEMQKKQIRRERERTARVTYLDYLASLNLTLTILVNPNQLIQRISQLTLKTNQFNLTTKRYTENDIRNFFADQNKLIILADINDKFGSYGITVLAIIELTVDGIAVIDTFLLSCRIIGRNIELAFFDQIIKLLKNRNVNIINAKYIHSIKNHITSDFFDKLGFTLIEDTNIEKKYSLKITDYLFNNIDYIHVTNDEPGD